MRFLEMKLQMQILIESIWQYFAVYLTLNPLELWEMKEHTAIHCFKSSNFSDAMTSDWARIPYEVLDIVCRRIVNEVKGCK